MADNGVEIPDGSPGLWNSMGTVIKNSDRRKAAALAGIHITDQLSLEQASEAIQARGCQPSRLE